jgi:hypothetical protein
LLERATEAEIREKIGPAHGPGAKKAPEADDLGGFFSRRESAA